jgi:hypothetical protein
MTGSGETGTFLDFVLRADFRFYQERTLGLDLYHSGYAGIAVFSLGVASLTVFLLAIFHLIPNRKRLAAILLGLGALAFAAGTLGTYLHFRGLPAAAESLVRENAGPRPAAPEQTAAVVALPMVVGAVTFAFDLAALLYLAVFWSAGLLLRRDKKKRGGKRD